MILISCLIITIYTIGMLWKHKCIPVSLSSTYYISDKKPWFTTTMFLTAIFMMIPLLDITSADDQWLVFLSCVGAMMCAVAPNFKEKLEGKIHYSGAVMAGLFSQLWCCLYNNWTLWIWCFIGIAFCIIWLMDRYTKHDSKIAFWAELLCFVNIYFTYFYYL